MSFERYKEFVEVNDVVIIFLGFDNMLQTKVVKDKIHQTRYGALYHNDIVGKRFGSKIQCTKGWLYILYPTPELWTSTLPHRTQILYSTDISMVTLQLDLKPGSVVLESGTGSASLSHAILRTIAPNGHLHTFDFHEKRVEQATLEFKEHGFEGLVTVKQRDVCTNGFELNHIADAVFLDLPRPWEALESAKTAFKKQGGRLCSFSPCIEQVQKTCEKLHELGFSEIHTMECLQRQFDVRTTNMPVVDLGHGPGRWSNAMETAEDKGGSKHHPVMGQLECLGKSDVEFPETEKKSDSKDERSYSKKGRYDHKSSISFNKDYIGKSGASYVFKSGLGPVNMPGHTGYLTFATLFPV